MRPLAGSPGGRAGLGRAHPGAAAAGVVSGSWTPASGRESSLFARARARAARGSTSGASAGRRRLEADDCNRKLVGARWFVTGFGEDNVRSTSSLSPLDDSGHGTQIASIAAGNAGVSVQVPGQRLGQYGGIAPQARIAIYKACWTAPDPADDGCATADLVTAIDRATSRRVDVLNSSVGGPSTSTPSSAPCSAPPSDIVVVAAAGTAAAPGTPRTRRLGDLGRRHDRRRTPGPGRAARRHPPHRRHGRDPTGRAGAVGPRRPCPRPGPAARARGSAGPGRWTRRAPRADRAVRARRHRPGREVAGGPPGRRRRHGACQRPAGAVSSPTCTPYRRSTWPTPAATTLRRWHDRHPGARVTLAPRGLRAPDPTVTPWSSAGDPTGATVKPDVVGPAVGVLGAVPPSVREHAVGLRTGTSAAAAWTSGLALRLRGSHRLVGRRLRSALVTSAASVGGGPSVLAEGAGRPRLENADRARLAYLSKPGAYRAWLDGGRRDLDVPSVLLSGDRDRAVRRITNVGQRPTTFSATVTGLTEHTAVVRPASVRLAPGRPRGSGWSSPAPTAPYRSTTAGSPGPRPPAPPPGSPRPHPLNADPS